VIHSPHSINIEPAAGPAPQPADLLNDAFAKEAVAASRKRWQALCDIAREQLPPEQLSLLASVIGWSLQAHFATRQREPIALEILRDVKTRARRFFTETGGQDMVEYTLLLAMIALAGSMAFIAIANSIAGVFSKAATDLSAATTLAQ